MGLSAVTNMGFSPKAHLQSQIYKPLPETAKLAEWDKVDASIIANRILYQLSIALDASDSKTLAGLLRTTACHWRDTLALTAHLRTFNGHNVVASALKLLHQERGIHEIGLDFATTTELDDKVKWVTFQFTFKTKSPSTLCKGFVQSVPEVVDGSIVWKIWSLTTWMNDFESCPEDEKRLREPTIPLPTNGNINTDVLIIGGGNCGMILGARLKALGVDFVIVEKNAKAGDNWANRYDCMRFHVYKTACHTPYIPYSEETSDLLRRDELSSHMSRFASELDLNNRVMYQSTPISTRYDEERKLWEFKIACPDGERQVSARYLILAHGGGYSGRFIPDIPRADIFKGSIQHSVDFRNAQDLVKNGAESAVVVGSANTAFDVMVDCYKAGLKTTMVQRSETYLYPVEYGKNTMGLGIHKVVPYDTADAIIHASPLAVGGPTMRYVHARMSEKEPDRYNALKETGFQVRDSREGDMLYQLYDRCGGHFMDTGPGVDLITKRKVGIKSGVVPVAYTPEGIELSDGSTLVTDAIIWCTGFGSGDGRKGIAEALGEGGEVIANKMEPLWGADLEGEIRGLYKRELYQDNVWVIAGGTTAHRFCSKIIALQIKGLMEGLLPEPYRETPVFSET